MRISLYQIIIIYVILTILAIMTLIPVSIMISTSLKSKAEMVSNLGIIPRKIKWDNYIKLWRETNLLSFFKNSVIVSIATVLPVLFFSSLAGFAYSRLVFPMRKIIYYTTLTGLMLPVHVTLVPLFQIIKRFNLINTYPALIGPYIAFGLPFGIFIFKNYIDTIPYDLDDAAKIDGCSSFGIYWRIILPVIRPALATLLILQFLTSWNEFIFALIFMTENAMKTLPLAVMVFRASFLISAYNKLFAGLCIISMPVLIVYLIFQKEFIKGLTAGALKG